jgi:hypothetical protein
MTARPCVGSGYCCKKAPCPYGEADETGGCRFLVVWDQTETVTTRYRCGRYAEIVGQPGADLVPAFGAGCCSSLNTDRRDILVELRARRTG